MILFLDIDGVLHTYGELIKNQFCYLPRFEAVLRDFPAVEIVISSDWRKHHDLEELQAFFSPDMAKRVVGFTPDLSHSFDKRDSTGIRHHEAHAWLSENKYNGAWIALDDDPYNWLDGDPLLFCDDGFTDVEDAALRLMLTTLL
ncbi:MAG: HAD domain-containing protein [Burkholderiaceae bacterium]